MGNCFKRSTTDDISLLRGGNEPNRESTEQLGPAPLYSVSIATALNFISISVFLSFFIDNYHQFHLNIEFSKCFFFLQHFFRDYFVGSAAASILSIAIGEPASESLNRRGAGENSKEDWFNTTLAHWTVRRL